MKALLRYTAIIINYKTILEICNWNWVICSNKTTIPNIHKWLGCQLIYRSTRCKMVTWNFKLTEFAFYFYERHHLSCCIKRSLKELPQYTFQKLSVPLLWQLEQTDSFFLFTELGILIIPLNYQVYKERTQKDETCLCPYTYIYIYIFICMQL